MGSGDERYIHSEWQGDAAASDLGVGLLKWWEEAIGLVSLGLRDIVDWPGAGLKGTGGYGVGTVLIAVLWASGIWGGRLR